MNTRECVCACWISHSHNHTLFSRKEDFFLFFSLLHPLTAAAAAHHPSSSSFPSQPEHSGRMATRRRGPSLFHESVATCAARSGKLREKKIRTRPTRILFFSFLFLLLRTVFTRTHSHTRPLRCSEEKKCCAHTHSHAHLFKFFVQLCSVQEKIRLFSRFERDFPLFAKNNFSLFDCHTELSIDATGKRITRQGKEP